VVFNFYFIGWPAHPRHIIRSFASAVRHAAVLCNITWRVSRLTLLCCCVQGFGIPGDLLGLIPGRQTYVFDKAGSCVLAFNSQMNYEQHAAEAIKAIKAMAA
jgi:hypothetical protein